MCSCVFPLVLGQPTCSVACKENRGPLGERQAARHLSRANLNTGSQQPRKPPRNIPYQISVRLRSGIHRIKSTSRAAFSPPLGRKWTCNRWIRRPETGWEFRSFSCCREDSRNPRANIASFQSSPVDILLNQVVSPATKFPILWRGTRFSFPSFRHFHQPLVTLLSLFIIHHTP